MTYARSLRRNIRSRPTFGLRYRAVSDVLIRVEGLSKMFRQGLWMRKVEAVKSVSFEVRRGDIFGFLGPNGAGKTTTIKMLTGLISPTAGRATLFGDCRPEPARHGARRVSAREPLRLSVPHARRVRRDVRRLSGLRGRAARDRTRHVLDQVGILYAADRPVRRLSKGMLQRTGLAAALVADPELLILDEPMSGLDPVGRKEVRDLVLEERQRGRTIFFSTHILSDVETMCDRVTILRQGKVVVSGRLGELLKSDVQRTDVALLGSERRASSSARSEQGHSSRRIGERLVVEIEGRDARRRGRAAGARRPGWKSPR